MTRIASILGPLAAAFFVLMLLAHAAPAAEIEGLWLTEEGDGIVRIAPCAADAESLCGRLVWVEAPLNDQNRLELDDENPEAELRTRPILGLPILQGFPMEPNGGVFESGTIYDPNNGKTYSCKITPDGPETLKIRGFIGVSLLGRTTMWRRVAEPGVLAGLP